MKLNTIWQTVCMLDHLYFDRWIIGYFYFYRLDNRKLKEFITFTNEGGTFNSFGIITEPKFDAVSTSKMLNQLILKIVICPGS